MQSCTSTSESTVVLGDVTPVGPELAPQLGRYRLGRLLGSGGMGIVFEAYDPALDRALAIKIDRAHARRAEPAWLQQEAIALARVDHPNVIRVLDAGAVNGQAFIAMELVRGRTLDAWLDDAPRSERDVVTAYVAAGRGLAAVHAAGLVHRDVKPQNILVDDTGHVRLIDFGLAHPIGAAAPQEIVVGTPAFMAPEQLTGGPVDARADQYSFCKALATALGDAPSISPHVAAAIERGMARDPTQRFASMPDLLDALGAAPLASHAALPGPYCEPCGTSATASPASPTASNRTTSSRPRRRATCRPAARCCVSPRERAATRCTWRARASA